MKKTQISRTCSMPHSSPFWGLHVLVCILYIQSMIEKQIADLLSVIHKFA